MPGKAQHRWPSKPAAHQPTIGAIHPGISQSALSASGDISAGCSSWRPPTVVKVVRTITNSDTISSKDYERLREVTEDAIDHIKTVDPHIRPRLTLSSQKNFVDEIEDQSFAVMSCPEVINKFHYRLIVKF